MVTLKNGRIAMLGALTLAASVAALSLAVAPAQAHSNGEAVRAACGSNYRVVSGSADDIYRHENGNVFGQILLGRVPGTNKFCVVTKSNPSWAHHGTETRMVIECSGGSECNPVDKRARHAVVNHFRLSVDQCVTYAGGIINPSNSNNAYSDGTHHCRGG